MKRPATLLLFFSVIVSLIPVLSCGTSVSGVETTNGFTVSASADDVTGTAPPNSQIYLCDTGYIPFISRGTGIQTAADLDGRFDFSITTGDYSVTVITPDGKTAGVHFENVPRTAAERLEASRTPQQPGTITGSVTGAFPADTLLVYLVGMCHYQLVTQPGDFTLSRVPPGHYRIRIIAISGPTAAGVHILYESDIAVTTSHNSPLGPVELTL